MPKNNFPKNKGFIGLKRYQRFFRWLKKPKTIIFIMVTLALFAGAGYLGSQQAKKNRQQNQNQTSAKKIVKTLKLDQKNNQENFITTVGEVKPDSQIEITALSGGSVQKINFKVGNTVKTNQVLAQLYDSRTLTNLNNALTNLNNMQANFQATQRLTAQALRQAETGVNNAALAVTTAQTSLKTSQDNLTNAQNLQIKNVQDAKDNAVVAAGNYLNTINSALDQINYVIKAEGEIQLPGIAPSLGAKSFQSLINVETSYWTARNHYNQLIQTKLAAETITETITETLKNLQETKQAVDDTIIVLDNTVPNANFSGEALAAQRNLFSGLRSQVVNSQTAAYNQWQALQNIDLVQKQQLDVLKNAVSIAQHQLSAAEIGFNNVQISLESSKQTQRQQILSAQAVLDNAQGQLNLAQAQADNLIVKAPINGQITQKYVEPGAEVNPGQKIAQISQANLLKIEIYLASQDVYQVNLGQRVIFNNVLNGLIVNIDPAADPITKKVKATAAFDNAEKKLIVGTFVDVKILLNQSSENKPGSIFIPLSAVILSQNENFVFVVKHGQAEKKQVILGSAQGSSIEVLEGLTSADEVIIQGSKNLQTGEPVEIRE